MPDALMYSRHAVAEHADRAAIYASHLFDMISIGDDVGALHAMRRLIVETRMAASAMNLVMLGTKTSGEPERRDGSGEIAA
jgi:hypothetical protein